MTRYIVKVPPTMEQGSYTTSVTTRGGWFNESISKQALRDYNSARAHDGLPPIKRMPKGTKYIPDKKR